MFISEDGNRDAGTETNLNENQEIYYHVLGTDQSEDILCWKDPENPQINFGTEITDDGKASFFFIFFFFQIFILAFNSQWKLCIYC